MVRRHRHPVLLDEPGFQTGVRGCTRDLACVVGLEAADADEGVAALRNCLWQEVFEFAGFVALGWSVLVRRLGMFLGLR